MKMRGSIGKPRRAPKRSNRTQIRIDPDTKEHLRDEFGSLGNALYFLSQSILKVKRNAGLEPLDKSDINTSNTLDKKELKILVEALVKHMNTAGEGFSGKGKGNGGGKKRAQIGRLLVKINNNLMGVPHETPKRKTSEITVQPSKEVYDYDGYVNPSDV